ncbi:MAG: MFS transporter [Alphaproteobacteria bacterium]|nr:MAG: MFS transporter [Alphaproteobacteria bacterium]
MLKGMRNFFSAYGNAILRYYDHALYMFFAHELGVHFFQNDQSLYVKIFLVYALGYFIKPLGGIILGYIADRYYGRKTTLNIALCGVAFSTFCIGILPSYETIGITSSILLIMFRLIQGIFMGSSVGMVYVYESATKYKNFSNSIFCLSYSIGIFLASLSSDFLYWRVPFLLQSCGAILLFFYSLNTKETFIPKECKVSAKPNKRAVLKAFLISGSLSGLYKFFFVFMCAYLLQKNCAFIWKCKISTALLLMSMVVTPLIGWIIDRVKHEKRIMIALYVVLLSLLSVYVYNPLNLSILVIISIIIFALELMGAPLINTFFTRANRCLGTSTAYSFASLAFSSSVPLISLGLEKFTGNEKGVFIYPVIVCLLGLIGILLPTSS